MWFVVDDHGEVGVGLLVVGLMDGRFGFGEPCFPPHIFFRGWDVVSHGSLHARCFKRAGVEDGWRRRRR